MAKKTNKRKTLLLLDGNAIIHRAYHALPPLTATDGTQTNAVYGFTSTLLNVLEKFQPEYVIATFDVPGKNFRHKLFSDYKATRKPTPEDLVPQFALTKDVVKALNIPVIEKKGVEADDVIGSLARLATTKGIDTVIVTGDKDTLQLVDEHVRVFTMSRGIQDMLLYDVETVRDKTGLTPAQVIEYKGLRGDTSDNIPGVRGIGDKGAVDLLTRFGDLDGVYAHIDDLTGSMHTKLAEHKDQAYLSRTLGTIKCDLDVPLDVEHARSDTISFDGGRAIFAKLGFTSLLKRLAQSSAVHTDHDAQQKHIKVVVTAEKDVAAELRRYSDAAVSVVCDAEKDVLHGITLADDAGARYVPCTPATRTAIVDFLVGHKELVTFDAKAFLHTCTHVALPLPQFATDVLLQAYVLKTGAKLTLEQLAFDTLGVHRTPAESGAQMTLALRNASEAQARACEQAQDTWQLFTQFAADIADTAKTQKKGASVATLLKDIEMPLVQILYKMERAGIGFDKKIFAAIATQTEAALTKLMEEIYALAGVSFNINSTQQLRAVLFDTLALPTDGIKKTKTGYSTAASELEKLRDAHPIIAKLEVHRELFKLKTTYIDALPKLVAEDGRIHSSFNQAVTATGRLSSSDPNLQNIPIRTETGRALREAFVAATGNVLISADYSQIDLRCVAHVAADKEMIRAFSEGADIHTFTAAAVLGKDPTAITKAERSSAKELNFGLIYGMGVRSFAKSAGIEMTEAKEFVKAYFDKFSGVKAYMETTKKEAKEKGYVETLLGRRKYTPELQSANAMLRAAGERAAINMPIQGLTADIMKLAMIAVDAHLQTHFPDESVRMVLQVHDEIIVEAPRAHAEKLAADIQHIMEHVYTLSVPLVVDTAIGTHWGEL